MSDLECDAAAPRCLGFGEDDDIPWQVWRAVVMHCSRPCDETPCPKGYACRRLTGITGTRAGKPLTSVSRFCGREVQIAATPLNDIPRNLVVQYFNEEGLHKPVVTLHWENSDLVVTAPGSVQRFTSQARARAVFIERCSAVERAGDQVQTLLQGGGPNAPGAIPPSVRKTLDRTTEESALEVIFHRERVEQDGPVLAWAPLSARHGLTVYGDRVMRKAEVDDALNTFFALSRARGAR